MQFTIPEIKIQRNDPIELQQRILLMSPTESKRPGINKSTLWYQKKKESLVLSTSFNLYFEGGTSQLCPRCGKDSKTSGYVGEHSIAKSAIGGSTAT